VTLYIGSIWKKELIIITIHMKITKGVKKMQIEVDDEITTVVSSDDDTASLNSHDENEDNAVSKPPLLLNTENEDTEDVIGLNCPERIAFVLDTSYKMAMKSFSSGERAKTNLCLVKQCIAMFIKMKSMLKKSHAYCVVIGQNLFSPFILQEFTSDVKTIMAALNDLDVNPEEVNGLDEKPTCLDSLVGLIDENIILRRQQKRFPFPDHVTRIILIGFQNKIEISMDPLQKLKELHQTDTFFLDTVLIKTNHDSYHGDEKATTLLESLNFRQENYNLHISDNQAGFFNAFAQLLAHPLQRIKIA